MPSNEGILFSCFGVGSTESAEESKKVTACFDLQTCMGNYRHTHISGQPQSEIFLFHLLLWLFKFADTVAIYRIKPDWTELLPV